MAFGHFFPLHWAGWVVATHPIYSIIEAKTSQEKDVLTEKWKEATLSTLTSVIYIGAILSAVTVGAFSWPHLEPHASTATHMICALWYSSLILSVTSVCIGLCQSVFLARISCAANGNILLRTLLIDTRTRQPRTAQSFVWLLAVGLLEWSVYLWLGGFVVFLWDVTSMGKVGQSRGDIAVAIVCGVAFLCAVCSYVLAMIELWYRVWENRKCLATTSSSAAGP